MADLNDVIDAQARQPIASSAGQQSATGRSIDDLIKASQHTAQVAANGLAHRGIAHVQLIPAGAPSVGTLPSLFNNAGGL